MTNTRNPSNITIRPREANVGGQTDGQPASLPAKAVDQARFLQIFRPAAKNESQTGSDKKPPQPDLPANEPKDLAPKVNTRLETKRDSSEDDLIRRWRHKVAAGEDPTNSTQGAQQTLAAQAIAAQAAMLAQRDGGGQSSAATASVAQVVSEQAVQAVVARDDAASDDGDLALDETSASDGNAETSDDPNASGASLAAMPLIAAASAESGASRQNNDHPPGRQGKGLFAELIEELVECLHVSERMRSDDWSIMLSLKNTVLEGARLHMENNGRRLSVKIIAPNRDTFNALMDERAELEDTLRNKLMLDIQVTTEQI